MAIISISGYAGSGKDTVGKIIQDLMPDYNWEVKKFAGKLKTVASLLTGIQIENLEDQEFKKTYLPEQWNYWTISVMDNSKLLFQHGRYTTKEDAEGFVPFLKQSYGEFRMEYVVGMQQMTVRQLLQELGTDAIRNGLHPNSWVNALMADYVRGKFYPEVPAEDHAKLPNWIITDTRFPNEAITVKERNGIMVRILRAGCDPVNAHPSETGLDDWEFDYIIHNNNSIKELRNEVDTFLKYYEFL